MCLISFDGVDGTTSAVDELCSGHEETDNKMIQYSIHVSGESTAKVIIV